MFTKNKFNKLKIKKIYFNLFPFLAFYITFWISIILIKSCLEINNYT